MTLNLRYDQVVLPNLRMASTATAVPDYRTRFKELQVSEDRKDSLIEVCLM
jgi:hypothetical protein